MTIVADMGGGGELAARRSVRLPLLPFAAAIYVAIFCSVYTLYLFPTFEYAQLNLVARSGSQFALMFFMAVAPVIAYVRRDVAGTFVAAIVYVLCYVPAIVVPFYSLVRSYEEIAVLHIALAISMVVLFLAGAIAPSRPVARPITAANSRAVFWVTFAMVAAVAIAFRQNMRLVSFADVYDLRAENRGQDTAIVGYITMWLSYCFLPFLLARGILYREWASTLLGLVGCVVIYAATGAKATILTPLFIFTFYLLTGIRRDFLLVFTLIVAAVSFGLVNFVPDDGVWGFLKSLIFMRTLGTPGWTVAVYYDFFSTNPLTYMSHVGILNTLTGAYPYGPNGLGQVIGLLVAGNTEANFNAGFWPTDGIAAFGLLGIYFATALVAGYIILLNAATAGYDTRFINLWICGFAMSLLNLPFFTAMLSGGGAAVILMALAFHARWPGHNPMKNISKLSL